MDRHLRKFLYKEIKIALDVKTNYYMQIYGVFLQHLPFDQIARQISKTGRDGITRDNYYQEMFHWNYDPKRDKAPWIKDFKKRLRIFKKYGPKISDTLNNL